MLVTRYTLAGDHGTGRDVLEVACGSGIGLGLLARRARRVVGGDVTISLLRMARRHYGNRIPVVRLDAQALPFAHGSFDVVLLYEAMYYLRRPEPFLAEAHRVLRPEGVLIICTVNREWVDFNPSEFSVRYYSADELRRLVEAGGFVARMEGAFPVQGGRIAGAIISLIKRAAMALRMMPKTMRGKRFLKRLFLGSLTPLPEELGEGTGDRAARVSLEPGPVRDYKVIYVTARKDRAGDR